ncbi:hypothetical protein A2U01_0051284, partial [Trifolium medium]|nr:hypothetical protein [Trifolium medium]
FHDILPVPANAIRTSSPVADVVITMKPFCIVLMNVEGLSLGSA